MPTRSSARPRARPVTRDCSILFGLLLAVVLIGCTPHSSAVTPRATGTGLTSASGHAWRAAYLGQDGRLHTVRLDGTDDRAGLALPMPDDLKLQGLDIYAVSLSPNAQYLAYSTVIADLTAADTTGGMKYHFGGGMYQISWSPDGARMAVNADGEGKLQLVDGATGQRTPVPGTPGNGITNLIGWLDSTHLAVRVLFGQSARGLASLDLTNGTVRIIVRVPSDHLGDEWFRLSSDGKEAFLFNVPVREDPYTPIVEVIDTTTGQIRSLPNIAHTIGEGFSTVAWKPGSDIMAVSTGYGETGNLKAWMLDLARDTVTHLVDGQHVQGWAPDDGPLVIGTGWQSQVGAGPYALSAVSFSASGQPTFTPLTHTAMTFPFLGFIPTQ
jgi:WD40 repeat protein